MRHRVVITDCGGGGGGDCLFRSIVRALNDNNVVNGYSNAKWRVKRRHCGNGLQDID